MPCSTIPVAKAVFHSKAVVPLLLIYCLFFLSLLWEFSAWSLFCFFSILCLSSVAIILIGIRESWLLALTVFLMSCDSQCSLAFPRSAVGWFVVCGCGIS